MMNIVEIAAIYAAGAHDGAGQVRRYTLEPYWHHSRRVAAAVFHLKDPAITAAAWLHDVVEDTRVLSDQIRERFGDKIANLVEDVTDVAKRGDGNRATRARINLEHLSQARPGAMSIKLADIIDNVRSIRVYDPKFAVTYVAEKMDLLPFLTEGCPILFEQARAIVYGEA